MPSIKALDKEYQAARDEFRRVFHQKYGENLMDIVALELFRTHPEVHWVKFRNGVMCAINAEYSRRYNIPTIESYANVPDNHHWPEGVANTFNANDTLVLEKNQPMRFIEPVVVDGEEKTIHVQKWPMKILFRGEVVELVAGRVIDG